MYWRSYSLQLPRVPYNREGDTQCSGRVLKIRKILWLFVQIIKKFLVKSEEAENCVWLFAEGIDKFQIWDYCKGSMFT